MDTRFSRKHDFPDGNCKNLSLSESDEVFFRGRASTAKELYCSTCPVQKPCLEWALDTDAYGNWAGTSRSDRMAIGRMLALRPV